MKTAQSRQKSYYDKRRNPLSFEEGDHVYMRVVPTTGIGRKVGRVAYQIALPPLLSNLHNVFQVSQLRKYISDPSHIIEPDSIQLKDNLTFETLPVRIGDQSIKTLRGKEISLVKVI
ncbi:PREDICTED: uncharacterized protein LOC109350479 [Lupinus angustifolius]|uniref:uncharacterized protein LOC109350479 n=1 Tax=Lupinus angustifolius TaxID=3871 RepID=UPI00092F440D|nr:PREDICTED: uncharacterized protein LOC109350479 [Lupinus angustifolius]